MTKVVSGNVVYRDGKYLLVIESCGRLNLPIGGKEDYERIVVCAWREGKEETGYDLKQIAFLGVYEKLFDPNDNIVGFIYISEIAGGKPAFENEVIGMEWLSYEEIRQYAAEGRLKGNYILKVIEDFRSGVSFPLSCVQALTEA